jgi:CRP-like cAMP-binding protein
MFDTDLLLKWMTSNPWFASLELHIQMTLLTEARLQRLNPGEYLARQGDTPGYFYGLVRGALKVSSLREDGKEAILTVVEPGNWFGQTSLLDGLPRVHDICATDSAHILCIDLQAFDKLMAHNSFARAIAVLQATHSRLVYKMLEDAMLRSTRVRIARRLEHLARGDATQSLNERQLLNVTQDDLAMMLGITRQTLALELKAMAAAGVLKLRYGQVQIESLTKLRAMESPL